MQTPSTATSWTLLILFDGECPLCRREIAFLRRRDTRSRLRFEDISHPSFEAARYGRRPDELMARIHALLPDGRIVEGVEVFRRAYSELGLGWLLAPTRWPLLRTIADWLYRWFARNRLRLTGRGAPCKQERCVAR